MAKSSNFAERLKEIMKEQRVRAVDLVNDLNLNPSTISHWLKGHFVAKTDVIMQLSQYFKVSETWLLGYDVPKTRYKPGGASNLIADINQEIQYMEVEQLEKILLFIRDFIK